MRPRTFVARAVGKLPCGSQPTAPTCVEWSWCLKQFFCTRLGSVGPKIHGLVRALMKFSTILYDFFMKLI